MPRGVPNAKAAPEPVEVEATESTPDGVVDAPIEPVVDNTAEGGADSVSEPTPGESAEEAVESSEVVERIEVFEAVRPDGTVVVIARNIDTGDQTVTEK